MSDTTTKGTDPRDAVPSQHVVVARSDEIPPGGRKIVKIRGRSIGVFNVNGEYFAVHNVCPHAGGALCEGVRSGFVTSPAPGQYEYIRRGEVLRCPWHQWEFDIRTGRSWIDPNKVRVRSYAARLASGAEILGSLGDGDGGYDAHDQELIDAGLQPGPFIVETFPVRAIDDYVIVTL